MHDGRRTRGDTSTVRVEDVLTADLPDDEYIDREYLGQVFQDPAKYLTRHGMRASRAAEEVLNNRAESILARRSKQVGLVAAVTVLISSVVTAAVLAQRPDPGQVVREAAPRAITGVEALGAFTAQRGHESMAESPAPSTTTPVTRDSSTGVPSAPATNPAPETSAEVPATGTTAGTSRSGVDNTRDTPSRDTRSESLSRQATAEASGKLNAARRFYRLVATTPSDALGMLAPSLLGTGPGKLLDAWRGLHDVQVEQLHERADGSVLAVVTMVRPDGTRIRVTQLLHFARGKVIDHVQLLSAQHT